MKQLFVDVDDTLVLYDLEPPNPYGFYYGTPYTVNERLLTGIRKFQADNPEAQIIIWSGGGKEYAKMFGERLGLEDVTYLTKDADTYVLVGPRDVVVDDQPISVRTHDPFSWPEDQGLELK